MVPDVVAQNLCVVKLCWQRPILVCRRSYVLKFYHYHIRVIRVLLKWKPDSENVFGGLILIMVATGCVACHSASRKPIPKPIIAIPLPPGPRVELGMDLIWIRSDHLFIVIDYHYRWSEVAFIKDTKTYSAFSLQWQTVQYTWISFHSSHRQWSTIWMGRIWNSFWKSQNITHQRNTELPYLLVNWGIITRLYHKDCGSRENDNNRVMRPEAENDLLAHRTTPHCTNRMSAANLLLKRKTMV